MKNIAYSLIMTVLFGSIFPSAQAYANGKKNIEFKNTYNTSIVNEDLVDKLAKSKFFESFYNQCAILSYHMATSVSYKSEKDRQMIAEKINQLNSSTTKSNESDNIEMLKLVGFDNPDDFSDFDKRLSNLKIKLNNEFPQLLMLNHADVEIVMTKAIQKANLESKFSILLSKNQCYDDAHGEYTRCVSGAKWWRTAAVIGGIICAVAVVACYFGTLVIPGGAAATGAFITLMGTCVTFAISRFDGNSQDIGGTCLDTYKSLNSECIRIWGAQVAGGAE